METKERKKARLSRLKARIETTYKMRASDTLSLPCEPQRLYVKCKDTCRAVQYVADA